ncbi:MmcQ/YjbR family DNA-binding protein [Magnetovibrio blakemorei]|uniref:MmcQ/YjbR family DNA-binding protein n=1 Tax=Magnetovibrio blakemorei TaxID=28181 RepID=A0A1E5QA72_9PROT|nr:MmcQ/YjbR family DNA-binding protein [Magnetovibrio blakemorei]OEJ68107.1 hypothetical protein BEN30_07590 [Magnetovibrio blakemorei]
MNRAQFDAFCASLRSVTHVVQWGGSSVWKVGGKIFAICSTWGKPAGDDAATDSGDKISFKCSDLSYSILCEQKGIIPAPYLARAKWVQIQDQTALSETEICSYIEDAHALIAAKLTRVKRTELGL